MENQEENLNKVVEFPFVKIEKFSEKESFTLIVEAELLKESHLHRKVILPILSTLTLLVWPICVYWSISLQRKTLYVSPENVDQATHIFVRSKGKSL